MLRHYLQTAIRSIIRHKAYTFINVSGLAIGMAGAIMILLYIHNELSFDAFHRDADSIYRVYCVEKSPQGTVYSAVTPNPLPDALSRECPELVNVVRFWGSPQDEILCGSKTVNANVCCTDPSVFDLFSFPLTQGDPASALTDPYAVVITEELARKCFGRENPLGKSIGIAHLQFTVTGILKKVPGNSSITFDMLINIACIRKVIPGFNEQWHSSGTYTYVRLPAAYPLSRFKDKLVGLKKKYLPDYLQERFEFAVQPLKSIHFDDRMTHDMTPPCSKMFLLILFTISCVILFIASMNFITMAMALSTQRIKEIGIRMVVGADKRRLIGQFFGESALLVAGSLFLGIILVEVFLPRFNTLAGKQLVLFDKDGTVLWGMSAFGLVLSVCSSWRIVSHIMGNDLPNILRMRKGVVLPDIRFRPGLVFMQFICSIILLICSFAIMGQARFMEKYDLGFDKRGIIAIKVNEERYPGTMDNIEAFRHILGSRGEITPLSFTLMENIPGLFYQNEFGVIPEGDMDREPVIMTVTSIDDEFIGVYGAEIIKGRNFSKDRAEDKYHSVILNETAVRKIGWHAPLRKNLKYVHENRSFNVIGIMKDIHIKSLRHQVEPMLFRFASDKNKIRYISIKAEGPAAAEMVSVLKSAWKDAMGNEPFEYFYLEDVINGQYENEDSLSGIIALFTLLAILLACLGLLGVTSFSVKNRTKEIGIRKIAGAETLHIICSLSYNYIKWILLANLIAWPIAGYAVHQWLRNFAYRMNMAPWMFVIPALLVLLIAFLSIGFHTIRAALANPAEALRYE